MFRIVPHPCPTARNALGPGVRPISLESLCYQCWRNVLSVLSRTQGVDFQYLLRPSNLASRANSEPRSPTKAPDAPAVATNALTELPGTRLLEAWMVFFSFHSIYLSSSACAALPFPRQWLRHSCTRCHQPSEASGPSSSLSTHKGSDKDCASYGRKGPGLQLKYVELAMERRQKKCPDGSLTWTKGSGSVTGTCWLHSARALAAQLPACDRNQVIQAKGP